MNSEKFSIWLQQQKEHLQTLSQSGKSETYHEALQLVTKIEKAIKRGDFQ